MAAWVRGNISLYILRGSLSFHGLADCSFPHLLPLLTTPSCPLCLRQEQSLLQPPTLQLLNGMGPLGRRASDGGANIQLHAQQLLKRPRGPSPLVTMTPVSSDKRPRLLSQRLLVKKLWACGWEPRSPT